MNTIQALPDMCLRFALAVALSGILGLERQRKARGAGLRTHILVCLGATMAVGVADLFSAEWIRSGAQVWMDKGRIAAGVLTGVGFLGAGTIMTVGGEQRGLTTAAMVWFVAALGVAIGSGYYFVAVCATSFALLTVVGLERFERLLPSEERFVLKLRFPHGSETMGQVERFLRENHCEVAASRLRIVDEGNFVDMSFEVTSRSRTGIEDLAEVVRDRFSTAEKVVFER